MSTDPDTCPCGSGREYAQCCQPLIEGAKAADTAEALLRSRYTAYVRQQVEYILDTVAPSQRHQHEPNAIRSWARHATWHQLEILDVQGGGPEDTRGQIEFIAHYTEKQARKRHHELAHFQKIDGRWYFYNGNAPKIHQYVRQQPKVGRNDPCPCGSGLKYKHCCGR
jgi:SEC-C motif-containing protein